MIESCPLRTFWTMLFFCLLIGCTKENNEPTKIHVETPNGDVAATKSTVDEFPQKITVVSGQELARLRSLSDGSAAFAATYVSELQNPDLKDYDRAFRVWQISSPKQHANAEVIDTLGGYLGNRCVDDFDMEWVVVTDKYGTDYAVRGRKYDVMAFPFSTVSKRIEDNEYDFLYGVYYTIKQQLESGEYKVRDDFAEGQND